MIDKSKILNALDIPEELLDELLTEYKVQAQKNLGEIQNAYKQQDYARIAALAHSLKGVSANLRLENAAQAARALEQTAKNCPQEPPQVSLLAVQIESLGKAINELLAAI